MNPNLDIRNIDVNVSEGVFRFSGLVGIHFPINLLDDNDVYVWSIVDSLLCPVFYIIIFLICGQIDTSQVAEERLPKHHDLLIPFYCTWSSRMSQGFVL